MPRHAHRLGRLLSFQIAIRAQVAHRMCALRLEWGHLGRSQATSPRRLFPVAVLSALETQVRFQMVFQRFVGAFARAEHPLVIFVDDLQWLDQATLKLIE